MSVELRPMRESDLSLAIDLGATIHARSNYANLLYDKSYLMGFGRRALNDTNCVCLVAESKGALVGFFVGCVQPLYFSGELRATDLIFFVKDGKAGMRGASNMIEVYETWAKGKGAVVVDLSITTGINAYRTGKFYEHLKYRPLGQTYRKEVNDVWRRK